MPSQIAIIEIYENPDDSWYYGCPDLDLMGYANIDNLLIDIEAKLKVHNQK